MGFKIFLLMSMLSLQYPLNFLGFMIMFSLMFTNTFKDTRVFLASTFLLTVLASTSIAHAQTAGVDSSSTIESDVDASIKPGDDFFAYANGAWLKATDIPTGKARWTVRDEIAELTRQQVLKLLDDASAAPAGSTARKVADFRAAYLNETAIETKGIAPLKPMLERIDRVRDKASLTRLLGAGLRADVDPMNASVFRSSHILGLAVQASIHGEKDYVAFLVQGGLGLADRENYISVEPAMQIERAQRTEAIRGVLALLNADSADALTKRAAAVMALETAIAQSHATVEASDSERNADNVWTRADFAQQAPGMDWSLFFTTARLAKQQTFVAWQPSAVKGVAALVASQSLQAWKDYLRVRLVDVHIDVLPRKFAQHASALRGIVVSQGSLTQRATEATQTAMREAIGRMYVERHFPAAHKARVQVITANVIAAFTRRIEAATWLSPATKTQALAKLKAVYFGVGYPEKWTNYSYLIVNPADAVGNLQRLGEFHYRQTLAKLGKRVDKTEWSMPPQRASAVLLFQQNSYNFAAALLQMTKFDPTASDAANYGAIGAIVGHEVSHFIDTLGAEYEADGRFRRWWTPEDMSQYEALTAPLIKQVASYQPLPDLAINGKVTLVENLADLGGLAAAFDAHRLALAAKANDKEYVRQQDRQFFLGFARSWRGKMTEAALRKYLAYDSHAPENYRIAIVRNIDAWYDAFDVQPGQKFYLEPKARVRIW
jgi:putative endopeptidase